MNISAIIVTYNSEKTISECLLSLNKYFNQHLKSIIIIDNGSEDKTISTIKNLNVHDLLKKLIVIESANNGFGNANNIGIEMLDTEYVILINPDVFFFKFEKSDYHLSEILALFKANNRLAVVGINLKDKMFRNQYPLYYKRSNLIIDCMIILGLNYILNMFDIADITYIKRNPSQSGFVDIVSGAFMFCKTDFFKTVRGFNNKMFLYGEEKYLMNKMLKYGYMSYYYSEITAVHIGSVSIGNVVSPKSKYYYFKSFYINAIEQYSGIKVIVFKMVFKIAITLRYSFYLFMSINKKKKFNEHLENYRKLLRINESF